MYLPGGSTERHGVSPDILKGISLLVSVVQNQVVVVPYSIGHIIQVERSDYGYEDTLYSDFQINYLIHGVINAGKDE